MFCEVWFAGLGRNLRKKRSRNDWSRGKDIRLVCVFKRITLSGYLETKKWRTNISIFFVIHRMVFFYPTFFLQQFLKLMSKIRKNDGYWCFTRILTFVSKIFRMAAFTFSSDLLFGYHQHLQFSTNAFIESGREKTVNLVFIVPQNFGTKIKIQKKVLTFCWIALVAA